MPVSKSQLRIDGKLIPVSNLDKVFYPETGFTKAEVIDYYIRVAPVLLPHLKGRSVTLKRYPDGVEGDFFYEKQCPPHRPAWIKTHAVFSERRQGEIHYCVLDNLASLVWAANLADLELHPFLWKGKNDRRPTSVVFDLDPGEEADILDCAEVALWIREDLQRLGLKSFPKTSGSKGLQLYVPLHTAVDFERSGAFAKALAQRLEAAHPQRMVSKMTKSLRKGKVLVDWSQNHGLKTTVCVYSLRAKHHPTVSTPIRWSELEAALKKGDRKALVFEAVEVLKRVGKIGDLFAPVLSLKQTLPRSDG